MYLSATIQTTLLDKAVKQFVGRSGEQEAAVLASLNSVQPIGRFGSPDEIAKTVRFLLYDDSSFITDALISANDGYACQ